MEQKGLSFISQSYIVDGNTNILNWLNGIEQLYIKVNDQVAESMEQDQTATMCSLILLYTLRKWIRVCERQVMG